MSKAGLSVVLTGDEAALVRSLQNWMQTQDQGTEKVRKFGKTGDEAYDKLQKAAKDAGVTVKEYQKMQREANRTIEMGKTSTEKYEDAVAKLDRQKKAGLITEKQHAAALNKVEKEHRDVAKASRKTTEQSEKAFGGEAVKMLAGYAAGLLSVSTAVSFINRAVQEMIDKNTEAKDLFQSMVPQSKRLAEVTRGRTAISKASDLQRMSEEVDAAAIATGLDREQLAGLRFDARSLGFDDDFQQAARTAVLLGTEKTSIAFGKTRQLLDNKLTGPEIVQSLLTAEQDSPLDFGGLASILPSIAEGGSQVDASGQEMIALGAVLSKRFGRDSTAGDRIKGFAAKLALNEKTRGAGIVGGFEKLRAMPEADRRDFLKDSQELNAAYSILLKDVEAVKDLTATINDELPKAGTGQSRLNESLQAMFTTRTKTGRKNLGALTASRSKVREEISNEERNAETGFAVEALQDAAEALAREKGASEFSIWLSRQTKTLDMIATGGDVFESNVRALDNTDAGLSRGEARALLLEEYADKPLQDLLGLNEKQLEESMKQTAELERGRQQPAPRVPVLSKPGEDK